MPKTTFNIKVELEDGRYCEGCGCLVYSLYRKYFCGNPNFPKSERLSIMEKGDHPNKIIKPIRLSECIEEHGGGE